MIRSMVIPEWVNASLKRHSAPLESVLNPVKLASILSPMDVGFYYATMDYIFNLGDRVIKPRWSFVYELVFRALQPVHCNFLDILEDAEDACEDVRAVLGDIRSHYATHMSGFIQMNDQGQLTPQKLAVTLWREPMAVLQGEFDETEGAEGYLPKISGSLFPLTDDTLFRCTGLSRNHFDRGNAVDGNLVMAIRFEPMPTGALPAEVAQAAYSQLMSILSQFKPLNEVLGSDLLSGYLNEKERLRFQVLAQSR